jgi:CMP/dCMP kinase
MEQPLMSADEPLRIIAIDGPAGAGKSTVGHRVAERLGLSYLDTGAQFRAIGMAAVAGGVCFDDWDAVTGLAHGFDTTDDGRVLVGGTDYSAVIRTPEAGAAASKVAVIPSVRAALVAFQRAWAVRHGGGVIEGRDIGSVVFPNAILKLYITASPEVRGERRSAQTGEQLDEVIAALRERDHRDKTRDTAPLANAADAIRVDTSHRSVDDIVEGILDLLKERTCPK